MDFESLWIYWLGPLVGALIAVGFAAVVHRDQQGSAKSVEAASGENG
jgi:hypothetical protein